MLFNRNSRKVGFGAALLFCLGSVLNAQYPAPQQPYPPRGPNPYPPSAYPQSGYPAPQYPQAGSPQPGYPQPGSSQQGYPPQGNPQGYPQQGYPPSGYPQPGAPDQQGPGEPDVAGPSVARISLISGDVSVRRGDSGEFVAAAMNAPLMAQDYLSTGPSGRAEVQFDYNNMVRLGAQTEVRFVQMDGGHYQMQIARGTVTYRVRTDTPSQQVELSTPSIAVHPVRRGSYRIAVLDDGTTQVSAHTGEVEVFTPKGTEKIRTGQMMMVRGTPADPEFQIVAAPSKDEWDTWNDQRDQQLDRSTSYQHMSRDIYGDEDLDANGRWMNDPQYGDVWRPTVAPGWAPYQVGRWVWEDYYGWTWVSGDPWGWAPYHYGSWFNGAAGWCWYPGSLHSRHFWRPALVAFFGFGGGGFGGGFGFGNVGWVPLAPFERFHPWYGRGYYGGYGRGVVNINIAHNTNITGLYRNARFGVNAVNAQDFAGGRFHNVMRVSGDQVRQAGLVRGALPLTPSSGALRFSDRQTQAIPRNSGSQARFYSRSQPVTSNRVPFAQQQHALQQSVGGQSAAGSFGRSSSTGGWNRFGSPAANAPQSQEFGRASASPQSSPNVQRSQPNTSGSGGWGRFGSPSSAAPSSGTPGYRQPFSSGSPSYGNRAPAAAQRSYSAPGQTFGSQNRYAPSTRSAPLQISPPIVRERSAPQQQYSRPSYSAPRTQSYSAPQSYGRSNGGGGYSAAPRSRGYSGGGHSSGSGGGQTSGGGSHNSSGGHHGR